MGHGVPDMIGVARRQPQEILGTPIPGYMAMGERDVAVMDETAMPLPGNTPPMMTGQGQYGPIETGGMFSVPKVREIQRPGDYANPGQYDNPAGGVARAVSSPGGED